MNICRKCGGETENKFVCSECQKASKHAYNQTVASSYRQSWRRANAKAQKPVTRRDDPGTDRNLLVNGFNHIVRCVCDVGESGPVRTLKGAEFKRVAALYQR